MQKGPLLPPPGCGRAAGANGLPGVPSAPAQGRAGMQGNGWDAGPSGSSGRLTSLPPSFLEATWDSLGALRALAGSLVGSQGSCGLGEPIMPARPPARGGAG